MKSVRPIGTGWGLGFAVRTNPDFSLIPGAVGSFNWQGSWGTFFSVDPAQKLILIMMMQRSEHSDNGFYFNAIRRLPYAALKVPEAPAPVASGQGNAGALTEYVGRYVFGGSASSLDRQTSVADGNGWTGLESVIAETDGLRVIKLADTGPAARAGVMAGDLITAIDDKSIKGLTLEAAFRRISGPVNAAIKFKIIRAEAERSARCRLCPGGGPLRTVSRFKSVSRTASSSLKQQAAGRSLISTRVSRRPWRSARRMNSRSRVAITRGSPSSATQPAKSTARFSIRDHGSNAAYSPNRAH